MLPADFDIDEVISKLSVSQKVKLLCGKGWWHTEPVPEVGIPSMRMSDGPNGVRGTQFFNGVPSSAFPSSTGLGSSFDVDLAEEVGKALADECRAKGCHILLGPTVNTQRSPLGGRGFESFSEDPVLNGTIAAAYINGLQSKGVSATIKHFVANDQEFERFSISADVSERALREIYLKPFQIALKKGNPWAFMYNRVNGLHVSEDKRLLNDVLRKEWGFNGLIMSDWIGVYSTTESIKAGLDLEMPGPTAMRGRAVERAMAGGKLDVSDLDFCVRNILGLLKRAYASGIPFDGPEEGLDTPEVRALLRRASADATVLLKNDKGVLPLKPSTKSIAVIGPNAKYAMTSGGGSARLLSTYTISPLEGIEGEAKKIGAEVRYKIGATSHKYLPLLDGYIKQANGEPGALVEFWNEEPSEDFTSVQANLASSVKPAVWSTPTKSTTCFLMDGIDASKVNYKCWIRFSTKFTPDESGDWDFGLNLAGRGNLFLDGKLVIDLSTNPELGEAFFGLGTVDVKRTVKGLKAGQTYDLEIRINSADFQARSSPFECYGGIRLGAMPSTDAEEAIREAVEVARASDVALLIIGLNHDWESEGFDRQDMKLPGLTNRLVSEVLKANPNTVVVNQSGTPVEMPWVDEAHTLLQAFYGGNEVGTGLADVLFGNVNPSGKLALTFPKRLEDNPSHLFFGSQGETLGRVLYNEGIYVGYRGFEKRDLAPLFPFGYGITYSSFEYSDLSLSPLSDTGDLTVTFKIKNTSSNAGREVAQVYVTDPESTAPRPAKELKGFTKVALQPGETKAATVVLDKDAFSYYDERKASWVAEKGKFGIWVGASSADIKLKGEAELKKTFTWTGL
ncbi:glycoside hydrolase family 3 protein [Schizophyllum commune]